MDDSGRLLRLFPVPFRLVAEEQQFRKWQWIHARLRKPTDDRRQESYRISVDTIEIEGEPLSTRDNWLERRHAIDPVPIYENFSALEEARSSHGVTLGLLRPSQLRDLQISKADSPSWTAEEIDKLMQAERQGTLFDQDAEQRSLKLLKKIPFDFYYHYTGSDGISIKHKLVDWEAGALYWNIHRKPNWQDLFRQRFLADFSKRDVLFLMGTIHRFPNQWLIVSVLYPPKPPNEGAGQGLLF